MRIRSLTVKREFYRDRYNQNKVWEVARLAGGYYLRQYVKGQQFGTGLRTSRKFIESGYCIYPAMEFDREKIAKFEGEM